MPCNQCGSLDSHCRASSPVWRRKITLRRLTQRRGQWSLTRSNLACTQPTPSSGSSSCQCLVGLSSSFRRLHISFLLPITLLHCSDIPSVAGTRLLRCLPPLPSSATCLSCPPHPATPPLPLQGGASAPHCEREARYAGQGGGHDQACRGCAARAPPVPCARSRVCQKGQLLRPVDGPGGPRSRPSQQANCSTRCCCWLGSCCGACQTARAPLTMPLPSSPGPRRSLWTRCLPPTRPSPRGKKSWRS